MHVNNDIRGTLPPVLAMLQAPADIRGSYFQAPALQKQRRYPCEYCRHYFLLSQGYAFCPAARSIACSTALGKRVSKSRIPTHSGVIKIRDIRGMIGPI